MIPQMNPRCRLLLSCIHVSFSILVISILVEFRIMLWEITAFRNIFIELVEQLEVKVAKEMLYFS